jgi:hypothetical protein
MRTPNDERGTLRNAQRARQHAHASRNKFSRRTASEHRAPQREKLRRLHHTDFSVTHGGAAQA